MNDTTHTTQPTAPELVRGVDGRVVAGVAAGVARRLGVDTWLVRAAFVLLTFFGGTGIALYLLGWIAIRDERQPTSLAQRWFCPGTASDGPVDHEETPS